MQIDLYNGVKQLCIDQSVDQFNNSTWQLEGWITKQCKMSTCVCCMAVDSLGHLRSFMNSLVTF